MLLNCKYVVLRTYQGRYQVSITDLGIRSSPYLDMYTEIYRLGTILIASKGKCVNAGYVLPKH